MSNDLSVTELVRHFSDYLNRIAYRGERFRLTRGGKPIAEIGPVASGRALTDLPELVAALPPLSDHDAAELADDIQRAREELSRLATDDRWTS